MTLKFLLEIQKTTLRKYQLKTSLFEIFCVISMKNSTWIVLNNKAILLGLKLKIWHKESIYVITWTMHLGPWFIKTLSSALFNVNFILSLYQDCLTTHHSPFQLLFMKEQNDFSSRADLSSEEERVSLQISSVERKGNFSFMEDSNKYLPKPYCFPLATGFSLNQLLWPGNGFHRLI